MFGSEENKVIQDIAVAHGVQEADVCLRWALQSGTLHGLEEQLFKISTCDISEAECHSQLGVSSLRYLLLILILLWLAEFSMLVVAKSSLVGSAVPPTKFVDQVLHIFRTNVYGLIAGGCSTDGRYSYHSEDLQSEKGCFEYDCS